MSTSKVSALILASVLSGSVHAAGPADLARESYQFLVTKEGQVDAAIRSGSRNDFVHYIQRPTEQMMARWPALGDPAYDKFRRCHFALDAFRVYSDDRFSSGGQLQKDAPSAKQYMEQKILCKKALPK